MPKPPVGEESSMETHRRSSGDELTRRQKVRAIFERVDLNGDGGLDRSELAALVVAVNPTLQFTSDQISSIIDVVFGSYSDFIGDLSSGLSLDGLFQTYADGAGDLDRDFAALCLSKENPDMISTLSNRYRYPKLAPTWLSSPNHGVTHDSTWKVIEELEIAIRAKIRARAAKFSPKDSTFADGFSEVWCSTDLGFELERKGAEFVFKEKSSEFRVLLQELKEIRAKIDSLSIVEEAFDGHLAIGRTLFERHLFMLALESFRRALELRPMDVRPYFRIGNTLWSLGHIKEAKDSFLAALEIAESDSLQWSGLLPQIHVNLGIVMEAEGLVINASEHYREAAILFPSHYRALKLLGSALFGVGEYEPAEKALQEAVILKPDYPDAHCDLGCVFHAMKEEEKAILAFQRAIDLKPDHLDALYNLGSLLLSAGRHKRAAEMFGRVVTINPDHWKAQLNRGISLFGAGELNEAKKALTEALLITNRIELYDAIQHLKQSKRKKPKDERPNWVAVDASKFMTADESTTNQKCLSDALWIREIQKATKLGRCDATLLKMEMETYQFPVSSSDRSVRKAEVEVLLYRLLHFLRPDTFRDAIKAIDEKIWHVLDITGSGKIDLGMFFAVIAPICGGSPEHRKRAAFDALSWQPSRNELQRQFSTVDVYAYIRNLRMVYFPSRPFSDQMEISKEGDSIGISFHEFINMFDNIYHGFGIMSTLLKLEKGAKARRSRHSCGVCRYRISKIMFKEVKAKFCVCANCYSECKVPSAFENEDEYRFKECLFE
ncbi:putative TPR repeat-containing protein [Dendrobium catenatum]|uniref:Putative TPR repeat-containing protein n=1 Tax=Dendrobium catenatum TaxID=906689 RepID=A0A2I0WKF0_9ASPA|nr:putative TPR repeat-containing protein [Dendrobium catenatum]